MLSNNLLKSFSLAHLAILCLLQSIQAVPQNRTTDLNSNSRSTPDTKGGLSHRFGPSEQLCGLTWANEAIRTGLVKISTPPSYYCKNSGGLRYRCGSCGLGSSPNPIGPINRRAMAAMSGKAYSCTAENAQGVATQVGDSTCIAYSIPDGQAGTIHCLSPAFEILTCLIGENVPNFDLISCTDCLLYHSDESDRGGIFRHGDV